MLGTLIFVVFLHQVHPHWAETVWGLVIEAVLIIEFALYWVVQTVELWNTGDRTELSRRSSGVSLVAGRSRTQSLTCASAIPSGIYWARNPVGASKTAAELHKRWCADTGIESSHELGGPRGRRAAAAR